MHGNVVLDTQNLSWSDELEFLVALDFKKKDSHKYHVSYGHVQIEFIWF